MKTPSVSVILSVFNGASYLREAIESVLNQTFKDFEFIIINDGSTDDTVRIINSFTDSRIVYLCNDENLGLVKSLNKGLAIARGEFIARMDADDISHPERLQKQVDFFNKYPDIGVVGTAMEQLDADGKHISNLVPPAKHKLIVWNLLFGCPIFHATVMLRRDKINAVGGYNPDFIHAEDTELWSRLIFTTRFANLTDVLYSRRLHKQSIMSTQFMVQDYKNISIRQELLKKLLGYSVSSRIMAWFLGSAVCLSSKEQKETQGILWRYYKKITSVNDIPIDVKNIIYSDLEKRLLLVNSGWLQYLYRKITLCSRQVIPMSFRHKLKTSVKKILDRKLLSSK